MNKGIVHEQLNKVISLLVFNFVEKEVLLDLFFSRSVSPYEASHVFDPLERDVFDFYWLHFLILCMLRHSGY